MKLLFFLEAAGFHVDPDVSDLFLRKDVLEEVEFVEIVLRVAQDLCGLQIDVDDVVGLESCWEETIGFIMGCN